MSSIEDDLPADVTPIKTAADRPAALNNLAVLSSTDIDAMFDEKAMLRYEKEPRPIVFIGNLKGRNEVALSISHLLGIRGALPDQVSTGDVATDLVYTYGTLPGGAGSPIFDAETGDLIGIHLIAHSCGRSQPAGQQCAAAGTSFPRLLSAIRART